VWNGVIGLLFDADEQRHLQPLPIAIDVGEADIAQPAKLCLNVEQVVGRIFEVRGVAERLIEGAVQARSWRGDVFEVAEHAPGLEAVKGLRVDHAFACVGDVVDRKARHHRIEAAKVGERFGEVMAHQLDATLVCEPLPCGLEHWLGDVQTDADAVGPVQPQQGEQASIARAEVQDLPGVARHVIEQDALTLATVRQPIGTSKVAQRVFWVAPLAH